MNTAKMKTQMGLCAIFAGIVYASAYLGPALDADHSGEFVAAQEVESSIKDIERQERFAKAAQEVCGPNAAVQDLGNGEVQCFTHRGKRTIKASL